MTKIKLPKGIKKDIIIVVIGVLIIWMGLRVVSGTDNPFYVVSSGSMVPELQVYDVLVVNGHIPFVEIEVGDVIVFNRPSGQDRVIVHRVAAITDEDPFTIRTKGDANPTSIPGTDFPITEEEYIGKVATVIPQIGFITQILQPPINYIIIAIIISIMIGRSFLNRKKTTASLSDSFNFESMDENNQPGEELHNLDIPEDKIYSKEIKKIENSEPEFNNKESSELIDDEEIKSENEKK